MSTPRRAGEHLAEPLRRDGGARGEAATAQVTFGMMVVVGLYTALSPSLVGFTSHRLATVSLIIGIAVAVLAVGFSCAPDRCRGLTWVVPVLGFWLAGAAWVLDVSVAPRAAWSNIMAGVAIVILGVVAPVVALRAQHCSSC